MRKNIYYFGIVLMMIFSFSSCSKDSTPETPAPPTGGGGKPPVTPQEPKALNLKDYENGSGVMMQTFYWDVEPRGDWWNILSSKVEGWKEAGVNRLWLPVSTKGASGGYSMGYDPSDYFDFGNYNQHGTVETRFGSREELENLIAKAHDNNLEVIADIVINHNNGGGPEYNPYRDKITYTLFDEEHGNASGMFNRNYEDFHPNSENDHDEGDLFFAEQDLDLQLDYVQDWLWKKENSVAKYYKNVMGYDGWRFDYVQGYNPDVIKQWVDEVGGFAVGENYNGDGAVLEDWVEASGINAFDFACFYKLEESLDRYHDLNYLAKDMLRKTYPDKAVTFVANHDTEKDTNEDNNISAANKMKAYAYILTHDGYPCIFYSDYENDAFQDEIKNLILIHNTLATGEVEVLYNDDDEYIMKRSGDGNNPGLVMYININGNAKRRQINTNWNGKKLMDYSNHNSYTPTVAADGTVNIEAPANGYSIYSIME